MFRDFSVSRSDPEEIAVDFFWSQGADCHNDPFSLYNSTMTFIKATWMLLILFSLHLLIYPSCCGTPSEATSRLHNVTEILSNLLKDYDVRLRPNFGGEPLHVGMDITLASFDSISEVNMDYTVTLCLNQYWKDERLAFAQSSQILTLSGDFSEKIWVPDTFFANDKNSFLHDVTERNTMVRLHADGNIEYGMRFTTTLACMMDLHYYPLDCQNCTVEIESYGYTVREVIMFWRDTPVVGVEDADLPQFTIMGYETNDRKEIQATGVYQRLSLSFRLQRNIGYFVFQTYLPSILIVMLSWVSFWINHEATSARVALGITTVLTMTTISTGVRSALPRISYVKAIDIYLVMCFVFVFAALLEYAAVNYTYWGARAKRKKKKEGSKGPPESQDEDDGILQLQDLRISPIPSLRNRHHGKSLHVAPPAGTDSFPPSFRIHRNYGYLVRGPAGPAPGPLSVRRSTRIRPRFFPSHTSNPNTSFALKNSFKSRQCSLASTLPKIKDVNLIDRYSRVVFPVSFILFNAVYWCFYVL